MSAANVFVTVTDPDLLMEGSHPLAAFEAAKIQLYRYSSEANARADSSGTLVTTFSLVASSTAASDPDIAGPYRYGVYDSSQAAGSWYRYRFADTGLANFSALSEPWESDGRPSWALRDIIFEIGQELGGSIVKGTATAGAVNTVTCASLFKSTRADARFYEGWDLIVSEDAGGAAAAPEGESARIDAVNTSTGVATLERDLSAAVASGDVVMASSLIDFAELIRVINRAREKMRFEAIVDIALASAEDRYPLPYGVRSDDDVLDAVGVFQFANSNRENEYPVDYRVVFDGTRGWIEFSDFPETTPVVRLVVIRNYRDLEGELADMGDTTQAPIEWMRPAFAYAVAEHLVASDPEEPEYQRLRTMFEADARWAAAAFGPKTQRRVKKGYGRRILPGPVQIA